jgi:tellurite resistance protein
MDTKEEIYSTVPSNRLQYFPIMMFAIIMGLSGLTIVFQKAEEILGVTKGLSTLLAQIDTLLFGVIIIIYLAKTIKYFSEVKKEFFHPVRINFFAASAISFLLLSIVYHNSNHTIALYTFYIGTIMQTFFTFNTISYWINRNMEIAHTNPAWFIPIVGNVLVPVAGAGIVDVNLLMYYYSIGLFFWVVFTAIIINRIIFHHQLAIKFIPTLFIFIAPPAVAFIAYIKMYGEFDMFASMLYNLALFFSFLLFFMYKNFLNLKFFISWWAFTFPLAAVTLASMVAYNLTKIIVYKYFSYLFLIITTLVVFFVAYKTLQHIFKKEICIME